MKLSSGRKNTECNPPHLLQKAMFAGLGASAAESVGAVVPWHCLWSGGSHQWCRQKGNDWPSVESSSKACSGHQHLQSGSRSRGPGMCAAGVPKMLTVDLA